MGRDCTFFSISFFRSCCLSVCHVRITFFLVVKSCLGQGLPLFPLISVFCFYIQTLVYLMAFSTWPWSGVWHYQRVHVDVIRGSFVLIQNWRASDCSQLFHTTGSLSIGKRDVFCCTASNVCVDSQTNGPLRKLAQLAVRQLVYSEVTTVLIFLDEARVHQFSSM